MSLVAGGLSGTCRVLTNHFDHPVAEPPYVPEKVGSKYITQSQKPENLKHSFVVGLSDPTSMLPAGPNA